jgi:hypothetical protein
MLLLLLMMMYVTIHRQQTVLSVRCKIKNMKILLHRAGTHYPTGIKTNGRVVPNELTGNAFEIPTLDITSNRSPMVHVYMYVVTFKTTEHFNCLSA